MASIKATIAAADKYAFESDGSVALEGRLGYILVSPGGEYTQSRPTRGDYGWAYHTKSQYLALAQAKAVELLAEAA